MPSEIPANSGSVKPVEYETVSVPQEQEAQAQEQENGASVMPQTSDTVLTPTTIEGAEFSAMLDEAYGEIEIRTLDDVAIEYTAEIAQDVLDTSNYTMAIYTSTALSGLEGEKSAIEASLVNKQADLASVYSGTHKDVKDAQNTYDSAYSAYNEALDASQNPVVVAIREQVQGVNDFISKKEFELTNCELQISQNNIEISKQQSTIDSLTSEIGSYDSEITKLKQKLSGADEATKTKIQSKIDSLEKLKGEAQARKTNEEAVLKALNDKKKTLGDNKTALDKDLNELKSTRDGLEGQLSNCADEAVGLALKNLQDAREALEGIKNGLISAINSEIGKICDSLSNKEKDIADLKEALFEEEQDKENSLEADKQSDTVTSDVYPAASGGVSGGSSGGSSAAAQASSQKASQQANTQDLKQNYETAKAELDKNRDARKDVFDGKNEELNNIKDFSDKCFDVMLNKLKEVDSELAIKIEAKKGQLDAKQEEKESAQKASLEAEDNIASLNTELTGVKTDLSALKEQLTTLNQTDSSDFDSDQKKEFDTNKSNLEAKIKEYEAKQAKIESDIKTAQDEKTKQEGLISDAQTAYEGLQSELDGLMEQAKAKLSEAKDEESGDEEEDDEVEIDYKNLDDYELEDMSYGELMQLYQQSREDYSTTQESIIKELNQENTSLQTKADELYKTYIEKEAKELAAQYSFTGVLPQALVKALDEKLGAGFCAKLVEICKEINCDPEDLLGMMQSESGISPSAYNPNGGASGLIQFMPTTAKSLGTTTEALRAMSAVEQLDYVKQYFVNWKGSRTDKLTAGDLYAYCFLPGVAGNEVLCSSSGNLSWAYSANSGLDSNKDGNITKSELGSRVQSKYQEVLRKYGVSG